MILSLSLALSLAQGQSLKPVEPELRVVAAHRALTELESRILTVPKSEMRVYADKYQLDFVWDGPNCLIWEQNLYDVKVFAPVIRAQQVLAEMEKQGRVEFKTKDLSPDDKRAVEQLLMQSGGALLMGPAIVDGQTPLTLGVQHVLTLRADGKEVKVWANQNFAPDPDRKALKSYSDKEKEAFAKGVLAKRRPKIAINQVNFTFSEAKVSSVRRANLISQLADRFAEALAKQAEAYKEATQLLRETLRGRVAPREGQRVGTLSGELIDQINASSELYMKELGFSSKADWDSFLSTATISKQSFVPTLTVTLRNGNVVPLTEVSRGRSY